MIHVERGSCGRAWTGLDGPARRLTSGLGCDDLSHRVPRLSLLFALSLVACKAPASSGAAVQEPVPLNAPRPPRAPELGAETPGGPSAIVVGVLRRQGRWVCEEGGPPDRGRWVDVHPAVGFVPLIDGPPAHARGPSLYGEIVVARGRVSDRRPLVPEPGRRACAPSMQLRSDYVNSPDGVLVRRKPAPLAAFEAAQIARYDGLSARAIHGGVEVTFVNRLGRPLPAPLVLRAHYEGCYGKPGTAHLERRAESSLANCESFKATFPRFHTRSGRQAHALASTEVDASGDRIWFDLDVSIDALGVRVSCDEVR